VAIHGIQRYVFNAFAWETSIGTAVNAAIGGGATVEAIDHAFERYINDQAARGLAYIGFTQVVREKIAETQRQARDRAANPPTLAPEAPAVARINPPALKVSSALRYGHETWTAELVGVTGATRQATTNADAWTAGRELQAAWLAEHDPAVSESEDPDTAKAPKTSDALRAVEGMTGVYGYTLADDSERFAAKWPGDTAGSTKTKRGFATAEAAAAYRVEQTTNTEAIAA
jgi:hypothetical protein